MKIDKQSIIDALRPEMPSLLLNLKPDAKPAGKDKLIAHCLHPDKHNNGDSTPSMLVFLADGGYKCQACGERGNLFDLYRSRQAEAGPERWSYYGNKTATVTVIATKMGYANLRNPLFCMVGMTRFELATPCSRSRCATRLRYIPYSDFIRFSAVFVKDGLVFEGCMRCGV